MGRGLRWGGWGLDCCSGRIGPPGWHAVLVTLCVKEAGIGLGKGIAGGDWARWISGGGMASRHEGALMREGVLVVVLEVTGPGPASVVGPVRGVGLRGGEGGGGGGRQGDEQRLGGQRMRLVSGGGHGRRRDRRGGW